LGDFTQLSTLSTTNLNLSRFCRSRFWRFRLWRSRFWRSRFCRVTVPSQHNITQISLTFIIVANYITEIAVGKMLEKQCISGA